MGLVRKLGSISRVKAQELQHTFSMSSLGHCVTSHPRNISISFKDLVCKVVCSCVGFCPVEIQMISSISRKHDPKVYYFIAL